MGANEASMTPEDSLQDWLTRLRRLRVDRSHEVPAPHKPLLLLSVLDLVRDGLVARPFVELPPELIEVFGAYWDAWGEARGRGLIALPFFHLRSEGFWHLVPLSGMAAALTATESVGSVAKLRQLVIGASIAPDLWALMHNPTSREVIRDTLFQAYFDAPQVGRLVAVERQMSEIAVARGEILDKARHEFRLRESNPRTGDEVVRGAAFRSAIVRVYDHTCAVCGLRLVTPEGRSAIEAAHIVPFPVCHNDDPRNGLGLCKLHHWCFDQGLVSVGEDMAIIPSVVLDPTRPTEDRLTELAGRPIVAPHDTAYLPSDEALDWHRSNVLLMLEA